MPTATSLDGTRIDYTLAGQGPAVILIDGALCFRENGPAPTLGPAMAEHFTMVTYDRRGRGSSGDSPHYSPDREIEDLNCVIEDVGGTPHLVGYSSGCALAIKAVLLGAKVGKVALFEAPFVAADKDTTPPPPSGAEDVRRLVADGNRRAAVSYFMTKVFGAPRFVPALMRIFDRSSWKKNESVAGTLGYDLEIMADWNVPSEASAIHNEVLVLTGGKSPKKLVKAGEALAASIPGARSETLGGQTHRVKAEVLTSALVSFFSQSESDHPGQGRLLEEPPGAS